MLHHWWRHGTVGKRVEAVDERRRGGGCSVGLRGKATDGRGCSVDVVEEEMREMGTAIVEGVGRMSV